MPNIILIKEKMMDYKVLWTDMHSNLHHEKIKELPKWLEQMKKTMDF